MSANYARKLYDDCFQDELVRTSKGPGNYRVNPDQKSNEPSLPIASVFGVKDAVQNPYVRNHIADMINIESHLRRIDDWDSRCVEGRTLEDLNKCGEKLLSKIPKNKERKTNLEKSYSRMENPAIDVRSMTTSRFDFPIEDPRKQVFHGMTEMQNGDMRFGINSRLHAKDSIPADYYASLGNVDKFLS